MPLKGVATNQGVLLLATLRYMLNNICLWIFSDREALVYTSAENNCEKHSAVHFFRRTRTAVFCVCSSAVVTAEPLKILATKTVEKKSREIATGKFAAVQIFRKNKTEIMWIL